MLTLPRENEVIAGKYRMESIVGRGGMGVVMAAWHLELDQRVALKFLNPELVERGEAAERFRREARAAARIKSEHVVRVLDVGNWEGNAPYMVMEYLDGRDLSVELQERGTLASKECVDYVLQAIEAVAEAHALGIVHRDLKPENLFLARRTDGTRVVKVLDFGISKTIVLGSSDQRSLTRTSNIMGSPFYMSPEQMRTPREVDARSDIWAIGAILYDLLAGRPPYVAETIPQLCTMLLENDPDSLRGIRPDVPEELERVVMRCLAKSTADRWGSVSELATALAPHASRSSRVHVERAVRVLGWSGSVSGPPESSVQSSHPPPPLPAPRPAGSGLGSATPTQASADPTASASDSATHDSWGRTQTPRLKTGERPAGSRSSWRWLVVGGALVFSIAVGVVALHNSGSFLTQGTHDSSPSVVTPKEPTLPSVPSLDPPAAAADEPAMMPIDPSGAKLAASATTQPEPTRPADSAAELAVRKPPVRPLPLARPKPAASSGLTDFGGRR